LSAHHSFCSTNSARVVRKKRESLTTHVDDEVSDQLKEDAGSRHGIAIMPQIPSGFGQNRGILFFCGGQPGIRAPEEYVPASPVLARTVCPVGPVMVTLALGTTAPVVSVTVPEMLPFDTEV
jgi:hypothetical protein